MARVRHGQRCHNRQCVFIYAPVGQLVESAVSNTVECQFESDQGYQK